MKLFWSSILISLVGCGAYDIDEPKAHFAKKIFFLKAPCTIKVKGIGLVDIEEEYVAGVISCENPHAPLEALKAQAVQARTFLYYKKFIEKKDEIRNSQADQVFRCDHAPSGPNALHKQAANETRGQYLNWNNEIIASFYVAGAIPSSPKKNAPFNSCIGKASDSDATKTEKWVTYNRGKTECDVEMTRLGFRTEDCEKFPYNRGCASQNGQSCLASVGVKYEELFSMYYGDDIKLTTADGECGGNPDPNKKYNDYCVAKIDGDSCFDNATRVRCTGSESDQVEQCQNGCEDGDCKPDTTPSFCVGRADKSYCEGNQKITCLDENTTSSIACSGSCEQGNCTAIGDFCKQKTDGFYCDEDQSIFCQKEVLQRKSACENGCERGECRDEDEDSLITFSEGKFSGCSSSDAPNTPFFFFWAGLLVLYFRSKKRKSCR